MIGLVADVTGATRCNNLEVFKVMARINSILPSCYFGYEELVPLADGPANVGQDHSAVAGHCDPRPDEIRVLHFGLVILIIMLNMFNLGVNVTTL
jgi:hypothetical protein